MRYTMMAKRHASMLVALLVGAGLWIGPVSLNAQVDSSLRGDRLTASVTVVVHEGPGDSVRVTYTVTNDTSSQQQLAMFVIRVPFAIRSAFAVGAGSGWLGRSRTVQDSMAASWLPLGPSHQLVPGGPSATFSIRARGVLGIVAYRAQGDFDLPAATEADETDPARPPPFWSNSFAGVTVGPVPAPPAGTDQATLLAGLAQAIDRACQLGWISPAGICTSLAAKVATDGGRWDAKPFLAELTAQRGNHVSEEAYGLLRVNADYIATH